MAALLVILTVIGVVLAFSVPRMWSDVMQRERELHTIWVMKQYAQAIDDYRRTTNGLPTKLEQLEKKTLPRVLRKTYTNPLSGELDWIMVPEGTPTPATQQPVGGPQPTVPSPTQPAGQTSTDPKAKPPRVDPREFSGPFIGVRPPQTGPSIIELFGQSTYESWMYTVNELAAEQQLLASPTTTSQPGN
ncbi:MAG: type II secretion system protein [Acidobacteria bacterium]|nr:type II secretion system protein [Acidobacteriota bacterium]